MKCCTLLSHSHSHSHSHFIFSTFTVKTASPYRFLEKLIRRPRRLIVRAINTSVGKSEPTVPTAVTGETYTYSSSLLALIDTARRFKIRDVKPSPEFGLVSLLFVLSMATGAILSLAVISIPAMLSMRRLAASMEKLSEVISKEVPATLLSLKLSGLEIKDLAQKLSILRQRISASPHAKKEKKQ